MIIKTPHYAFKGVWIPAEIWECEELTWMEKCLCAEIYALDGPDGCYASNAHFAMRFGSSEKSISNQIAKLRKMGLVLITSFDGRVRRLRAGLIAPQDVIDEIEKEIREGKSASTRQWMQAPPPSEGSVNPPVDRSKQRVPKRDTHTGGAAAETEFGDADGNPPESLFDTFWRLYPRHTGKEAARKSWIRQDLNRKGDLVIAALTDQKRAGMFRTEEPRFIPHPATWLNQARWEDEITHEKTKPTVTRNPQSIHMRQRDPERCAGPATEMATIIDNRHRRNKPIH
jgi:DNA-binding transcriptional ArsR family regulator